MSQERVSNDEVNPPLIAKHLETLAANPHCAHHQFLTRLTTLFSSTHAAAHGSVYLTQKALGSTSSPESPSSSPPQILVRATNGLSKPHRTAKPTSKSQPKSDSASGKIKLATVVEVADLEAFYARYAEVCKKGMEGLRKRDKKKAKEKAKAKKKGKAA
jgi:signal recognition particle subunit SRP14